MRNLAAFILLSALVALTSCQSSASELFLNETYHTGYVDIETRGSTFYWLFESRNESLKDPLVIYLNSMQGLASEFEVFLESGPYRINQTNNNTLTSNPYSWNKVANVLYVDAPLGTGFSEVASADSIPNNHSAVADDLYTFLKGFLVKHPEYIGRDLYIRSHSQSAKTMPLLGARILDNPKDLNLTLKGFLMASAMIADQYQIVSDAQFAYENGLINETLYTALQQNLTGIAELLSHNNNTDDLSQADQLYGDALGVMRQNNTINMADIRKLCIPSDYVSCYDFGYFRDFMAQPEVIKALGVTTNVSAWSEYNNTVYYINDLADYYSDHLSEMSALAQRGIPIVFYAGDKDLDVNWIGCEKIVDLISWEKQEEFAAQNHTIWEQYGEYKHVDNLVFMKVYNSGIFVGMDQPETELMIFERLVKGW